MNLCIIRAISLSLPEEIMTATQINEKSKWEAWFSVTVLLLNSVFFLSVVNLDSQLIVMRRRACVSGAINGAEKLLEHHVTYIIQRVLVLFADKLPTYTNALNQIGEWVN